MELTVGFKQTDIGPMPSDWDVVPLGQLVRITSGESPSRFVFQTSGTPYYKVEQLSATNKYLSRSSTPYHFDGNTTVPARSVVFAKRGAAIALNKVRILTDASFMDTNLMALTPGDRLDAEYLYYALAHIGLWRFADTTSVPQINNKHINPLQFPLPTLAEQESIARVLGDVDALLDRLDQLIAKKRDLREGVGQELLGGRTRLPGFSDQWTPKKLADLGWTYGGLTGKSKAHFGHGRARYVTFLGVMANVVIDPRGFDRVEVGPSERQNVVLPGDLILTSSSETPEEVAMCAVMQTNVPDLYLNSFCFGFRLYSEVGIAPLFLAYYMRSSRGRELVQTLAQGSTRFNISKRALLGAEVILPKQAEQTAIAGVLRDIDAELESLRARRRKVQDLRLAMMQGLLTGKARLIPPGGSNG